MNPYQTQAWLKWPPGIPKDRQLRELKLVQIRAEEQRPMTPDEEAEFRSRVAAQAAKDHGAGGLFGQ